MPGIIKLAFTVFLLTISAAGIFSQTMPCDMEFTVRGLAPGKVRLYSVFGSNKLLSDSTQSDSNGHFTFRRDELFQGGFFYLVFSDNSMIQLLLDQDQSFRLSTVKTAIFDSLKVEGCLDTELFYSNALWEAEWKKRLDAKVAEVKTLSPGTAEYLKAEKEQFALVDEKDAKVRSYLEKYPGNFFGVFKSMGQNPRLENPLKPDGSLDTDKQLFLYKKAYWKNFDWKDERILRTPVYFNKLKSFIKDLTYQQIDSLIAAAEVVIPMTIGHEAYFNFTMNWMALEYKQSAIMGGEKIYVHIIEKYLTLEYASWATADEIERVRKEAGEMKNSFIGNKAQELICRDLNGSEVSLLNSNAPVTLLFMYSPDCEHCQTEAPDLVRKYNESWKQLGIRIFALCVLPKEDQWRTFVAEYHMEGLVNAWDPQYSSSFYKKYYLDITPELYLINKEKIIVAKDLKPGQVDYFLVKEGLKP